MKKNKTSIIFLTLCLFLFFGGLFWWFWATSPVCTTGCQTKIFVIKKGEGLGSIAQRLEKEGLIRSSVAFQVLVIKEGLGKKIQAGDFRLNPTSTPGEITQKMTHGTLDRWVTLLEGWRREEMAEKLSEVLKGESSRFSQAEFLSLTKNLEGRLFPDTYLFPIDVDASHVASILTANFEKKTADLKPTEEALVLASLVEREAKHEADRSIVAGILLKRIEKGWSLQVDASVQYAVASLNCSPLGGCEWWPKQLTRQDLAIKSAYNTYLYPGLPPKPIANPSVSSIKAALDPTKTEYWYYLSDSQGDIHYAKNLEEHNQNIQRYLK